MNHCTAMTFPNKPLALLALVGLCLSIELGAQASPEVMEDGRVTFRCRADHADRVAVHGQFGAAVELEKDGSGTWSGSTTAPVEPGVYEYRFKIDGRDTIDSRNPQIKPQRWPNTSILHIASTPPALWDIRDIPHGTIHRHVYHSKVLDQHRELIVYTPSGMTDEKLPVLYLAHGYSDNQRTWTEHGKAHSILDALIHEKRAVPMIIVMSDAHAIDPGGKKFNAYAPKNTEAFSRELLEDVIPFVESHYPVNSSSTHRAFAGLSMGGHHALSLALSHSESFSHIGAFSAAPPSIPDLSSDEVSAINTHLRLLWIACGDKDFLFARNQAFHAKIKQLNIESDYQITPGADHSWPVWRGYLIDFAPKLFR